VAQDGVRFWKSVCGICGKLSDRGTSSEHFAFIRILCSSFCHQGSAGLAISSLQARVGRGFGLTPP